ncbi:glycosyltransferase family 4 protein [Arthrobacter rhombi]|uniref:glycosyltransferase family 4 protein n=1 Tax=Arthrobacter rhombi TaxID=71253 RepID=UPI003FD271BB
MKDSDGQSLRITIVCLNFAPETSGNAPYTTSLATELVRRGHQVTAVTGYPHYPQWRVFEGYGGLRGSETVDGVTVKRLRHPVPRNPTNIRRALMELVFGLQVVTADWRRPDVVLFVSPALISSLCGLLRARVTGIRAGIWIQDLYSLGTAETGTVSGPAVSMMVKLERFALRLPGKVVVIHEVFRRHAEGELGIPQEKVEIIRNWTHLGPERRVDRMATRLGRGWSENDIIVLHAGNLGVKQGLENVLESARLADSREAYVRFVLLGDGNQRARLQEEGRGISRLEFIDPVSDGDFQALLAAADILLVNERPGVSGMSVPSKLTSYFNSGLPVVAVTDPGSATAFEIEASQAGLRVDTAKPEALLAAVVELGRNAERREILGRKGLAFRRDVLGMEAGAAKFEKSLLALAESGRRRSRLRLRKVLSNFLGLRSGRSAGKKNSHL